MTKLEFTNEIIAGGDHCISTPDLSGMPTLANSDGCVAIGPVNLSGTTWNAMFIIDYKMKPLSREQMEAQGSTGMAQKSAHFATIGCVPHT